ncbi:MAG: Re/Si-specific NAD(P)(+) transhydrogenase subunit alpha [Porticoccaceae bacterium]
MIVGVFKEVYPGERRVALVPASVAQLAKQKVEVVFESGAGQAAGYLDNDYIKAGAKMQSRDEIFANAQVLAFVRGTSLLSSEGAELFGKIGKQHQVIGFFDPLGTPGNAQQLAAQAGTAYAMELVPRITRAQSMDALSSMANLAGYKAVLLAANQISRILPMMTTAAGTMKPAKVLVLGVGVAGLQAIATAKRLGAAVEAYDIRPEVKEQVQSVGGKFVELELDTSDTSDTGGYAKEQSADFIARQQEALAQFVRSADIVITTAQIPGRKAPILVTTAMQKGMKPGSVIVDLAAETGGNCELTQPGQTHVVDGVTMLGPTDLPSSLAYHSSQLYARNVVNFLLHITDREGQFADKDDDEIVRETRFAKDGVITHPRVEQALKG